MRLKTPSEIAAMRRAGEVVAVTLRTMAAAIVPNQTTTLELDEIAAAVLKRYDAKAPLYGYKPSFSDVPYMHNTCISVNDEVIHGVPDARRVLREGDLVSLDMDASVDGWCADATITVPVGKVSGKAKKLLQATREALQMGIAQARPGNTIGDVGYTVQRHVEKNGFSVVREMVGHGIGRMPHEPGLDVPNWGKPGEGQIIQVGMTFCIEPMVNAGKPEIAHVHGDPWTIVSADGSLACHFEHTIAITENGPVILTLPPKD
ncbi:MAG: type I methionyl aminopeptidase [Akkermansiaceae bacterium]|nr:type I methionyl aminopeptidase [Armatimonadota bacterium]